VDRLPKSSSQIPDSVIHELGVPWIQWRTSVTQSGFRAGDLTKGNTHSSNSDSIESGVQAGSIWHAYFAREISNKDLLDLDKLIAHLRSQPACESLDGILDNFALKNRARASRTEATGQSILLARLLRPALTFAADKALLTIPSSRPNSPFTVEEILHFFNGRDMSAAMLDRIFAATVAHNGTLNVSYLPIPLLESCLRKAPTTADLTRLVEDFHPPKLKDAPWESKIVLIRDPNGAATTMAICEVVTSRRLPHPFIAG
jgi:hypothetical protein